MLQTFRNLIAPVAQLLTVVGVLTAVAVWGYKLQDRVERLEAIVQTIVTSPVPAASTNPTSSKSAISNACEALAERYAAAATTADASAQVGALGIKQLMGDLGCLKK